MKFAKHRRNMSSHGTVGEFAGAFQPNNPVKNRHGASCQRLFTCSGLKLGTIGTKLLETMSKTEEK